MKHKNVISCILNESSFDRKRFEDETFSGENKFFLESLEFFHASNDPEKTSQQIL